MNEYYAIAAFAACATAFFTVIGFWMRLASKIAEAKADAGEAKTRADDAAKAAADANLRAIAVDGVLSMFKEQVARDYVSHTMLDKTEGRLIAALKANIEPLTAAIEHLTDRFDRFRDKPQ